MVLITDFGCIEVCKEYEDGECVSIITIKYDDNQNRISTKITDANNNLIGGFSYEYNSNNNLISITEYDSQNVVTGVSSDFVMDSTGQVIQDKWTEQGTGYSQINYYQRYGNHNRTWKQEKYQNGVLTQKIINQFDSNGNRTTTTNYDSNNVRTRLYSCVYINLLS